MKKLVQQLFFAIGISSCVLHPMEMELVRDIQQKVFPHMASILTPSIKKIIALYLVDSKHLAQAYKNITSFLLIDTHTARLVDDENFISEIVTLLYKKFALITKADLKSGLQLAASFKNNEPALEWLKIMTQLTLDTPKALLLKKFVQSLKGITPDERLLPILDAFDPEQCIRAQVYSPLAWAAYRDDKSIIEQFTACGASINETGRSDCTALMVASERGNESFAKYLIEIKNAEVDYANSQGRTALMYAVQGGNLELVKYLLETKHASIKAKNETPLMLAAQSGHYDIFCYLLDRDPAKVKSVKAYNKDGITVLMFAAKGGNLKLVQLILNTLKNTQSQCAAINKSIKSNGYTALLFAAEKGHVAIMKYLLEECLPAKNSAVEKSKRISARDTNDNSALMIAAQYGHLNCVNYLLDQEELIKAQRKAQGQEQYEEKLLNTQDKNSALLWAAAYGHLDIVTLLVDKGASIDHLNSNKKSPLLLAAVKGHSDVVFYLIGDNKTPREIRYQRANVALQCAAYHGHLALVDSLSRYTNIYTQRTTPLMAGAQNGHLPIVEYLLSHGADINSADVHGNTALICAVTEALYDFHQDLTPRDKELEPYSRLLPHNNMAMIKYLVSQGANIFQKNKKGFTAIDLVNNTINKNMFKVNEQKYNRILTILENKDTWQEQTSTELPFKKQKCDDL